VTVYTLGYEGIDLEMYVHNPDWGSVGMEKPLHRELQHVALHSQDKDDNCFVFRVLRVEHYVHQLPARNFSTPGC